MISLLLGGCAGVTRTPILVPPEAVREWGYSNDGQSGPGRYVIRMTDGQREWEVEFPDAAFGSEVRVPLKAGGYQMKYAGDKQGLTGADREIEDAERAERERLRTALDPMYSLVDEQPKGRERPLAGDKGDKPDKGAKADKAERKKGSYLVGVAQIRQLYDSRNYEVALVQLVDLEKDYPNDEKLLSMKGSIYRRLGKTRLARAAWEKVLALNPDNTVVAGALRELEEQEERAKGKDQPDGE